MALLIARALQERFVSEYPLFYAYLSFVLLKSCYLLVLYLFWRSYYGRAYWYIEPLSAILGCAAVWEIYRCALRRFPGAARMARNVFLMVLAIVASKIIADNWNRLGGWPAGTAVEIERDLRAVQLALLIGLLAVIAVYRIPVGRNVWGMILGYGLFISSNFITLTLRAFLGDAFQRAWSYVQPLTYVGALFLWCITLWSYHPVSFAETRPEIERDYQLLVQTTTRGLLQARTYLRRALRP